MVFLYFFGCNCSRVFIASGGFVRAVERDAASVADVKLMVEESVGDIVARCTDGAVVVVVTDIGVGPAAASSVVDGDNSGSLVAKALNVLFPHS